MSPLNSPRKDLNSSIASDSPKDAKKKDFDKQVEQLQVELNKNCTMVNDLEKALESSRSKVSELEQRLAEEMQKNSAVHVVHTELPDEMNKDARIKELEDKVKELEPLMKDYFSTSKKLTDAERACKDLKERLEETVGGLNEIKEKFGTFEQKVSKISKEMIGKGKAGGQIKKSSDELNSLNLELRAIFEKTITTLDNKEMGKRDTKKGTNEVYATIEQKDKEIEMLQDKLRKLKQYVNSKEFALKETAEKYLEFEFKSNEKEIENEDLCQKLEEKEKRIEDLDTSRVGKITMLQETGEELAKMTFECEKAKRMVEEYKANIKDLEQAFASKETELIQQDKTLVERAEEIAELKKVIEGLTNKVDSSDSNSVEVIRLTAQNEKLHQEVEDMKKRLEEKNKSADEFAMVQKELNERIDELLTLKETQANEIADLHGKVETLTEQLHLKQEENASIEKERKLDADRVDERLERAECEMKDYQEIMTRDLNDVVDRYTSLGEMFESKCNELKSKTEELDQKTKEMEELSQELHNKAQELENKAQELAALQEKYDDLKKNMEELSNDGKLSEALIEVAELKSSLHNQRTLHHKVKGELEEALLTVGNNTHELDTYKKEIVELKEKLEQNNADLEQIKELKEEIDNRNDELEVAENVLSELREVLQRRDVQVEELHNEIRKMTKDQKDKETKLENFEAKFKGLENKILHEETSCLKIEELESLLACEKTRNSELSVEVEKIVGLNEKIAGLEAALASAAEKNEEFSMLADNFEKTELRLEETEEKLSKYETDLRNLQDKLNEKESALNDMEQKLMKAEHCKSDLTEQLKLLEEKSCDNHLDSKLKDINDENERLKEEKDGLERKLEDLNQEISVLKNDICVKDKNVDSNNEKIATVTSQFRRILLTFGNVDSEVTFDCLDSEVDTICDNIKTIRQGIDETNEMCEKLSNELESSKKEKDRLILSLELEVENQKKKVEKLCCEKKKLEEEGASSKSLKDNENELKSQLSLKEVECETLNLELKMMREEQTKLKDRFESLQERVKKIRQKSDTDADRNGNDSKTTITSCDNVESERLEELQRLYECEKQKNEEYQKLLAETSESHCLSPQTGVRKLRKEKIETENALLEARYKVGTLEKKVADLESKQKKSSSELGTSSGVPVDRFHERKANNLASRVQELEKQNKELIREVTQLEGEVTRLQNELR